jgi:hypothetical protein
VSLLICPQLERSVEVEFTDKEQQEYVALDDEPCCPRFLHELQSQQEQGAKQSLHDEEDEEDDEDEDDDDDDDDDENEDEDEDEDDEDDDGYDQCQR